MRAAELFVQCIENEGAPFVFGWARPVPVQAASWGDVKSLYR